MGSFLTNQNNQTVSNRPRVYLNWMILDEEQFQLVKGNYGVVQVPEITGTMGKQLMQANNGSDIEVKKNGYLYVYVSNESQGAVYFDDLRIEHTKGSLIEETHYYPFGLVMSGISSKAAGGLENKKKYNGIDLENDFDLNVYDAFYRELDPQTGRFIEIDPKTEDMYLWSPYVSNFDNPITYSDPLGDEPEDADGCCGGFVKAVNTASKIATGFITGAVVGVIDNNYGSNIRGTASGLIDDPLVAKSWNSGLNVADVAGMGQGVGEGILGIKTMEGSAALTVGSGGLSIEVSGPAFLAGGAATIHGLFVTNNASKNLISQNGRVNSSSTTGGNNGRSSTQQSKVSKSTTPETIGNGKYTKVTEVRPSKKSPGQSRAEYVRIKNSSGKVVKTYKDSYDRANKFQGRKPLRGGPEGRPQNE